MRRARRWARIAGLALGLMVLRAPSSRADGRARADLPARLADPDPTDGRIDGDLDVVAGLGAVVSGQATRGTAELRLRYVETAGVFVTYEDGFGEASTGPARAFATGVELRPLFLARWLTGGEIGLAWPDLVIDSFGLEVGACFQQPATRAFDATPALQAGVGLELPLFARATGPWVGIHAGARWNDAVLAGGPVTGPSDRAVFLSITLAYHQVLATHLIDLHDRAP